MSGVQTGTRLEVDGIDRGRRGADQDGVRCGRDRFGDVAHRQLLGAAKGVQEGGYRRLQKVKATWDPTGFFRHAQSVQPA
ncbi:BBE domain-containing protein [Streptomyces longwoodensis]|uniref:BBE domain-containing protein n=1 Tax=Streptomyces longwoodensis TaxID=68231 RepID=UPI0033E618A3